MHREEDVIDVWFDSGAMPFAQRHYPFEHKDDFEAEYFPADFISEGIDQTRGWFYSLMAISVLYAGRSPYRRVLVNDLILDKNGQKMSKSKGNTLDPFALFDEYGADAVRFYSLYVSPPWLPTRFDVTGLKEVQSKFFRTIKNVYAMFALYANTNEWDPRTFDCPVEKRPEIDRWLLSRFHSLVRQYHCDMDRFDYNRVVHAISDFVVEDFSNWYIRRNRNRFWSSEETPENQAVFRTTWEVLYGLSKLIAPVTPFLADELYQALTQGEEMDSVHLEYQVQADEGVIDEALEKKMDLVRRLVNLGRAAREDAGIKVRQPLSAIRVDRSLKSIVDNLDKLIAEELNVKEVIYSDDLDRFMQVSLKPNFKVAGKVLGADMKAFAKYLAETAARKFLQKLHNGAITLPLNGHDVTVTEDHVLVNYQAKEGFDVTSDHDTFVVLETSLTPELIDEGYVREFISKVQQMRKNNGYDVSDRITIRYCAKEDVAKVLENASGQIQSETLSTVFDRVDEAEGETVDINGHEVTIAVNKREE